MTVAAKNERSSALAPSFDRALDCRAIVVVIVSASAEIVDVGSGCSDRGGRGGEQRSGENRSPCDERVPVNFHADPCATC